MATDENCIFCKIIAGKIPSRKFIETDKALIIPKYHAAKFHELPDDTLSDILPVAKKIALATGATDYNLLQNNGRIAHQVVDHVHFHVIPKPNEEQGLVVGWPSTNPSKEELDEVYKKMQERLEKL
ncbi:HNT1 [Malassezia furfur]|nr:HNT1 [Malassezia furfur]